MFHFGGRLRKSRFCGTICSTATFNTLWQFGANFVKPSKSKGSKIELTPRQYAVTGYHGAARIALLRLRLNFGVLIDDVVGDPAEDGLIGLAIVRDENVVAVSCGNERSTDVVHRVLGVGQSSIAFHESETA